MAILGTWEDGSAAWHEARATRIGGSDIGTIMGWSPFESRQQLLERKAGLAEPKPMSAAMKRGHWLEPAVLAFLADKHGIEYDEAASNATYLHDEHPWVLYNPDGITTTGVLVEAKTTGDRTEERGWGRAGTGQVPVHYAAQVTWGMAAIGATECYLGVLSAGHNGRVNTDLFASYRITFDPESFAILLAGAQEFMADLTELRERRAA